ncbi:MAG: hypothetical protein J5944_07150 [Lentisphaeria bacterium]|nr:hypothetical protein [Lentisphaeria bacterium]
MSLFKLPRKKKLRSVEFFCLFFLAVLLSGCLPKESVELRSGVRWEYVDYTHSRLLFENGEVLGPADISLRIRDDCIFGSYYEHEKGKATSFFMFEFKNGKLHRKMDLYEIRKLDLNLEGLYNQVEILGQFKSGEKYERLLRGEANDSDTDSTVAR